MKKASDIDILLYICIPKKYIKLAPSVFSSARCLHLMLADRTVSFTKGQGSDFKIKMLIEEILLTSICFCLQVVITQKRFQQRITPKQSESEVNIKRDIDEMSVNTRATRSNTSTTNTDKMNSTMTKMLFFMNIALLLTTLPVSIIQILLNDISPIEKVNISSL